MTAEGEDIEAEPMTVHECDPPRRLVLSWDIPPPATVWHVELDLTEAGGVTTLTFAQRVPDTATGRDVGPGWEYYLDRLVAAQSGGHVLRRGLLARVRADDEPLRGALLPRLRGDPQEWRVQQHVLGDGLAAPGAPPAWAAAGSRAVSRPRRAGARSADAGPSSTQPVAVRPGHVEVPTSTSVGGIRPRDRRRGG